MNARALLPEFDQEMANTRKVLSRIPGDALDWAPHEKSFTMAELAGHIANVPLWWVMSMQSDGMDFAEPMERPPVPTSVDEILARFDDQVGKARAALEGATEEDMSTTWTARNGDEIIFAMPRSGLYRAMILNHLIHHRGQLTVYLRKTSLGSGIDHAISYG